MRYQVTAITKTRETFGWVASGFKTQAEAEMAKNDHINILKPTDYIGYVILSSDGSVSYYDQDGGYITTKGKEVDGF